MTQVGRGNGFIIAIYWCGSQGLLQKNSCKKAICEGQDVTSSKPNLVTLFHNRGMSKQKGISPVSYSLSFLINIHLAMVLDSPNEELSRPLLWNNKAQIEKLTEESL